MAFERSFGKYPGELAKLAATPWGKDLLRLWRPAGQHASEDRGLRLAVRNRTLNFYRRGRAVAKVGFDQNRTPWMDIHIAYVTGKRDLGQHYARLSSTDDGRLTLSCKTFDGQPPCYDGRETLASWIDQADKHKRGEDKGKGYEKEFVDELVTHNPQVIDLEMALPGLSNDQGKLVAPRMDLVALEDTAGALRIVFWEAKLMDNKELRCRPETGDDPHIVGQLKRYTDWLGKGTNEADVIKAYQANCRLLCELHDLAQVINPEIMPLDPMIDHAAKDSSLTVDKSPRVIVRDPDTNKSWTEKGHHAVLVNNHDIRVQLISGERPASYVLEGRE